MNLTMIYVLGVLAAASMIIVWSNNTPEDDRQHLVPLSELLLLCLGSWLTVLSLLKMMKDD